MLFVKAICLSVAIKVDRYIRILIQEIIKIQGLLTIFLISDISSILSSLNSNNDNIYNKAKRYRTVSALIIP
ncbi:MULTISPECIES: hypothetical protein [Clostridium]|uniref:hypothetical protein n=1 Tax=Clostridium TaxID=1485 RepID=UPI00155DB7FC|nr:MULTISPECIES: hypothetical protein [Clostridium]